MAQKIVENKPPFMKLVKAHVEDGVNLSKTEWDIKEDYFSTYLQDRIMIRSGSGKIKKEKREGEDDCVIF